MRNLARTCRGNTKNDKRDAFIVGDTARTRPDALRPTNRQEEFFTSLKHLNGLDDDLRRHTTSHINQLRAVLLKCSPELEKPWQELTSPGSWAWGHAPSAHVQLSGISSG